MGIQILVGMDVCIFATVMWKNGLIWIIFWTKEPSQQFQLSWYAILGDCFLFDTIHDVTQSVGIWTLLMLWTFSPWLCRWLWTHVEVLTKDIVGFTIGLGAIRSWGYHSFVLHCASKLICVHLGFIGFWGIVGLDSLCHAVCQSQHMWTWGPLGSGGLLGLDSLCHIVCQSQYVCTWKQSYLVSHPLGQSCMSLVRLFIPLGMFCIT